VTFNSAFQELATHGKDGFYKGRVAQAIVDVINEHGGVMTLEDLYSHYSTTETPIHVNYRGINIYEIPPNGQGITALMALNILEGFDLKSKKGLKTFLKNNYAVTNSTEANFFLSAYGYT